MDDEKRKRLEAQGWTVGSADEFLDSIGATAEPEQERDWAIRQAAELLPCRPLACRDYAHKSVHCATEHQYHSINCPVSYRSAVATALREAERRGYERGVESAAKILETWHEYLTVDNYCQIAAIRALATQSEATNEAG